jgi:hypothetical protein
MVMEARRVDVKVHSVDFFFVGMVTFAFHTIDHRTSLRTPYHMPVAATASVQQQ